MAAAKSRIETANRLLQSLPKPSKEYTAASALQCGALVQLLQSPKSRKDLDCETKAVLADLLSEVPWAGQDKATVLSALVCIVKKRRDQQNASNFLNYVSTNEWTLVEGKTEMIVGQTFCDVLVHRMNVVNPAEHTIKFVASAIIVQCTPKDNLSTVPLTAKKAMQTWVQKTIKGMGKALK